MSESYYSTLDPPKRYNEKTELIGIKDPYTEACTHAADLLLWVKMVIKIYNSKIVTDNRAYWVSPSNFDTFLQPEMLFLINFRSSQFKKKSIKNINSSSTLLKDGMNSPSTKKKTTNN